MDLDLPESDPQLSHLHVGLMGPFGTVEPRPHCLKRGAHVRGLLEELNQNTDPGTSMGQASGGAAVAAASPALDASKPSPGRIPVPGAHTRED